MKFILGPRNMMSAVKSLHLIYLHIRRDEPYTTQ